MEIDYKIFIDINLIINTIEPTLNEWKKDNNNKIIFLNNEIVKKGNVFIIFLK